MHFIAATMWLFAVAKAWPKTSAVSAIVQPTLTS